MKALITIIILALVAWGIWWLVSDGNNGTDLNTDNTTGQASDSLDDIFNGANGNDRAGTSTGTSSDETSGFDDKG